MLDSVIGRWKGKAALKILEKEREEGGKKTMRQRDRKEEDGGRRGGGWSRTTWHGGATSSRESHLIAGEYSIIVLNLPNLGVHLITELYVLCAHILGLEIY